MQTALRRAGRQRNIAVKADEIITALRGEQLQARPGVVDAYGAGVRALLAVIAELVRQEQALQGQVEAGFGQHPDAEVYLSQPGLGPVLAARVLAEFGDAPNRYHTATARKNYAGTSPITRESGRSRAVLARHGRNRRLADALYRQAFAALKASPGARAYYDTPGADAAPPIIKRSAPWATGSSRSCTAAFASTISMTKTSPGRSTTAHIKLPLDIFTPWDVLRHLSESAAWFSGPNSGWVPGMSPMWAGAAVADHGGVEIGTGSVQCGQEPTLELQPPCSLDTEAAGRTSGPVTRRPPRWVIVVAHAVPLLVLPCGLWRIALGFGVPLGFHGAMARTYEGPGWITLYVLALSVISEALALLTIGLVRPWGEVAPAWIPLIGGKPIPAPVAGGAALLGAAAVTYLTISTVLRWTGPDFLGNPDAPHGAAGVLMSAVYAPWLAWGPLLAVVAVAYLIRRRRPPTGGA